MANTDAALMEIDRVEWKDGKKGDGKKVVAKTAEKERKEVRWQGQELWQEG